MLIDPLADVILYRVLTQFLERRQAQVARSWAGPARVSTMQWRSNNIYVAASEKRLTAMWMLSYLFVAPLWLRLTYPVR